MPAGCCLVWYVETLAAVHINRLSSFGGGPVQGLRLPNSQPRSGLDTHIGWISVLKMRTIYGFSYNTLMTLVAHTKGP